MATTLSRTVRRTRRVIRSGAPTPRDIVAALAVELFAAAVHLPIALHLVLAVVALAGDRIISAARR